MSSVDQGWFRMPNECPGFYANQTIVYVTRTT